VLLRASQSDGLDRAARRLPFADGVAGRLVVGPRAEDAVRVAANLLAEGLMVTIDHVGDVDPVAGGTHGRHRSGGVPLWRSYQDTARQLAEAGLTGDRDRVDLAVRLPALAADPAPDGPEGTPLAEQVRGICETAREAGVTVTLQGIGHTEVLPMLALTGELQEEFPWLGVTVRAHLHRSEADCAALAARRARVRLSMGMAMAPDTVAYASHLEIDRSYVRCLRSLMAGEAYPMIATHDPRMTDLAEALAAQWGRPATGYEFQLPHGVQAPLRQRLVDRGQVVRVRVPFGTAWYGYLMRRTAERPASAVSVLRRRRG
jgi:proline dehydrogenase